MEKYESVVIALCVVGLVLYVAWPELRPRAVSFVQRFRAEPGTSDHELAEPMGVWSVVELDPPRDRSCWPKWQPTPKGRWE
jgi:hypothetical protein